ncbi:MAG TPA: hypothetical protein PLM14_00120 [Candidatus Hydrogenedentes bacterium]|nr:hypothetical protein [Candidatus Hydrogenedentota bacterium]HQH50936.1 hypothetical protein [Candidatus Hydrogenedentota bacterium]
MSLEKATQGRNRGFASWHGIPLLIAALALAAASGAWAGEADSRPSDMSPAVIAPDLPMGEPLRDDLDQYGGWLGLKGERTGFFHVQKLGNRWWFITPEGNAYFMLQMGWTGIEDVPRIKSWGFNAAEEDNGMPYAKNLDFFRMDTPPYPVAKLPGLPPWVTFPDVFHPDWPKQCAERAEQVLGPIKDDPLLLGYYMVNEMCLDGWYEAVTHTGKDAPSRAAFIEVARAYYADKPADLAKDWQAYGVTSLDDLANVEGEPPSVPGLKDAWVAALAERAFSVAANAARAVDPNHLNLGIRMINAPLPEPGILAAMSKYCDVISMNLYSMFSDRLPVQLFTLVPAIHAFTGRPTMTTEFSFRAGDTLHPNTMGALPAVKTQADRAVGYLSYVAATASIPSHIGVSWYKYPDDGLEKPWNQYAEDCNFGVIDPARRPYAVLTETMRAVNAVIYELAADPVRNEKIPLFWRTELMRWDLALDEVVLGRLARTGKPFEDPMAQQLLEPRRYHQDYWVHHESPSLTVNDGRFVGWCQANMIRKDDEATTLTLLNVLAYTTFPRELWLGAACASPEEAIVLESNAQFLSRRVTPDGRVLRLTMADGSYIRTDYDRSELRVDRRVPYLDLRFDYAVREVTITVRGSATRLGVAGAEGWNATCNGKSLAAENISTDGPLTVFSLTP